MTRAGREPAEDVKRRLVRSCRAAELTVLSARMYLRRDFGGRLILVSARQEHDHHDGATISLLTFVGLNGDWSGSVDIRCSAGNGTAVTNVWDTLVMQGRHQVPLDELLSNLRRTLEEREQVLAAIKLGVQGPYVFEHARWDTPACLL